MKQKWPILIFSALLTAFIVLAGIWGNAQFEHLHSGSVLTAQQAVQGIALDGWRQEAPDQWHFTFTVGEDIPSLTLCVTNTAVPLAHENLTSLERSGDLYALDVMPGETVELVFTCGRSPQTWLMTSAFADRAFRFRTMTQLIALTAFVTMGMVLLALYHYKHLPERGRQKGRRTPCQRRHASARLGRQRAVTANYPEPCHQCHPLYSRRGQHPCGLLRRGRNGLCQRTGYRLRHRAGRPERCL